MADPLTMALTALSAAGTLAPFLGGGEDILKRQGAPLAGGTTPIQDPVMQMMQQMSAITPTAPTTGLQATAQSAQQAAQSAKPPKVEAPKGSKTEKTAKKNIGDVEIGEILAAIPDALPVVAGLLGLNDVQRFEQRPAPVAGGEPGGFVLPTPVQQNLGQLLASLPGIR